MIRRIVQVADSECLNYPCRVLRVEGNVRCSVPYLYHTSSTIQQPTWLGLVLGLWLGLGYGWLGLGYGES